MTEQTHPEPISGTIYPPPHTATAPRRSPVSPTVIALALASPAVTGCMLALARHWSDHGARHSIGDMVPLTLGAIIGLAITAWAAATKDAALVGTAGSLTAAALAVGMMAYPAGLAEPLIVTAVATVTGWILTRRVWRARGIRHEGYAERAKDREHQTGLATIAGQTAISVATIAAQGQIETARVGALGELAVANARADAIEFEAWQIESRERRAAALELSPTARGALKAITGNGADIHGDLEAVAEAVLGPLDPRERRAS